MELPRPRPRRARLGDRAALLHVATARRGTTGSRRSSAASRRTASRSTWWVFPTLTIIERTPRLGGRPSPDRLRRPQRRLVAHRRRADLLGLREPEGPHDHRLPALLALRRRRRTTRSRRSRPTRCTCRSASPAGPTGSSTSCRSSRTARIPHGYFWNVLFGLAGYSRDGASSQDARPLDPVQLRRRARARRPRSSTSPGRGSRSSLELIREGQTLTTRPSAKGRARRRRAPRRRRRRSSLRRARSARLDAPPASPIATSTGDGSAVPALHALPPETATPSRSSAATSSGPRPPGERDVRDVRRARGAGAVHAGAGRERRAGPASSASRSGATAAQRAGGRQRVARRRGEPGGRHRVDRARAQAALLAAAEQHRATAQTPGPREQRADGLRARGTCGPRGCACRPPQRRRRCRPKACTASTWTRAPVRRAARDARRRTGCTTPVSAFTACTATRRTSPSPRARARGPRGRARPSGAHAHPADARAPFALERLGDPRDRRVLEPARRPARRAPRREGATGARGCSPPSRPTVKHDVARVAPRERAPRPRARPRRAPAPRVPARARSRGCPTPRAPLAPSPRPPRAAAASWRSSRGRRVSCVGP